MIAFLFTFVGEEKKYGWVGYDVDPEDQKAIHTIHNTASFFMHSAHKYCAIGGGG